MNPNRFLWFVRRARNMPYEELSCRLMNAVRGAADYAWLRWRGKSLYDRPCAPASFAFCRSTKPVLPELSWEFRVPREVIERWLSGKYEALGYDWMWTGAHADWHRAPDTNREWPRKFFAFVDFRPGNGIGDARTMWEPNRLQHLVSLALIARFVPERAEEAANLIKRQVLSWLAANPTQLGVNYVSALECALRILSVSFASDLVRPHLARCEDYWGAVGKLILEHAALVHDRLSLFSSLGNHTVAECTGLMVAALLFPEAAEAQRWERRASVHLLAAARAVVLPDGGPAEQAFHYHAQVLDYLQIAISVSRHFGRDVSELAQLHRTGSHFLARFGIRRDQLPNIGDDDEGYALSRHMIPSWADAARDPAAARAGTAVSCFTGGGYTNIRIARDDADLILDHGPLGFAPNFAHGHADALALLLRIGGRSVLADCGTFSYGAEGNWRSFFRDTAAHNTIVVNHRGQADQTGAFLWSSAYDCRLLHTCATADAAVVVGRHDGFRSFGVLHVRAIRAAAGRIAVLDRLTGEGQHSLSLRWHFTSPLAHVEAGYRPEAQIGFRCYVSGGTQRILHGSEQPRGGWFSERYGRKAPCWTLETHAAAALPHEFTTAFLMPSSAVDERCEADFAELREILERIDPGRPPTSPTPIPLPAGERPSSLARESALVDG